MKASEFAKDATISATEVIGFVGLFDNSSGSKTNEC
jgi:hypothetical protein